MSQCSPYIQLLLQEVKVATLEGWDLSQLLAVSVCCSCPIRSLHFIEFGEVPYALLQSSQLWCPSYFIFHVQRKHFEISVVDIFNREHHYIKFYLLKTELLYIQ